MKEGKKLLFLNFKFLPEQKKKVKEGLKEHNVVFHEIHHIREALYDYHIILIDLRLMNVKDWLMLHERRSEINQLLMSGGVIICHPSPMYQTRIPYEPNISSLELINKFTPILRVRGNYISKYSWLDFVSNLSFGNRSGDTIKPNEKSKYYKIFKEIFKEFELEWDTDFEIGSYYTIKEINHLAFNRINKSVASVIDYEGNGKVIFFPMCAERSPAFYINLINSSLRILEKPPEVSSVSQVPSWLSEVTVENERKVIELEKSVNERKENIFRIKQLLFETNSALVSSVKFVFELLGYKVKNVEKLGDQDIEISREEFRGIAEVKGLERCATLRDLRQLLDYRFTSETKLNKGIFVVNHFRNKKPNKRKSPYHEKCIEKSEKVGFCLMTSLQLFRIYNEIIAKQDNTKIDYIRRKIEKTVGLLDF